jgi:hypothetical protein
MTRAFLLLPEMKRCVAAQSVARGVLARWVSRADRVADAESGMDSALKSALRWHGTHLPVAALTREYDAHDASGHLWLRADPAHVRADMTTARMLACGDLGLDAAECIKISRDLKPLFGDFGFEFDACTSNRWYLHAPLGADLPDAASPDEAMGDDLKLHLPKGAAGKRWRALFNEVQVLLHNHPVNQARLERGAVSVNSLWFWGAGALPSWVKADLQCVFTDAIVITELARLAAVKTVPLDVQMFTDSIRAFEGESSVLLDLTGLRGDALDRDWLQAVDSLLQRRDLTDVQLVFESGERFRVRPMHRFRFWRSVRELQA